ncbi:hypothetical protein [Clostridium sp. 19966]|uniref:hypothetical protein n=1 Tax=Clostridium sp. 19966 TaxID=2768166 RepID=UPI0028EF8D77|nr:hypothetical protein [Clostridium sp. 19966]
MERELLRKGDKVVMHTCGESEGENYGKVWTCRTDEFMHEGKNPYGLVFLEGFSGSFATEFLQKIDFNSINLKEEAGCYASCECGYITESMPIKDLLYKLSEDGGYIISDKEGGYYSQCPNCGESTLNYWVD